MADEFPIFLEELLTAITIVRGTYLSGPMQMLLYGGIDAMAYYAMPATNPDGTPKEDVKSADFIDWVNKYLLPGSSMECTAEEVYAARCSWLHSHGFQARLNRMTSARMICYANAGREVAEMNRRFNQTNPTHTAVFVDQDEMLLRFFAGARACWQDIQFDPAMRANAENRLRTGGAGLLVFSGQDVRRVSSLDGLFEERARNSLDSVRRVRKWLHGPDYDWPPAF